MKKVGLFVATMVLAFAVNAQTPTPEKKEACDKSKTECCKSKEANGATCDKKKEGKCCKSKETAATSTEECSKAKVATAEVEKEKK